MAKRSTKSGTVNDGEVWAVPAPEVGYFPLVIARAPQPKAPVPFSFAYLLLKPSKSLPDAARIAPLADWGRAWIGLVPERPFNAGRWKRAGRLPNFNAHDWPILPEGSRSMGEQTLAQYPDLAARELASIQTTRDIPTMTLLENHGVEPAVAATFPSIQVLTQVSKFESALRKFVQQRKPNFWDLALALTDIDRKRLDRWRTWAQEARARCDSRIDPPIPPGRTTDRNVKPGDWLGFPMAGGGFGAALVVRRAAGVVIFGDAMVYAFPHRFDFFPTLDEVRRLTPEHACFLGGTSLISVRDGRWRVLGHHHAFNPDKWPIPQPWRQQTSMRGTGEVLVPLNRAQKEVTIPVKESILKLDPLSGEWTNSMYSADIIETEVGEMSRSPDGSRLPEHVRERRITPARLAAWRSINKTIESAVAAR